MCSRAPATSGHDLETALAWVPPQRQEFRALSPEAQANGKGRPPPQPHVH